MPEFFAVSSKGLIEVLESELKALGLTTTSRKPSGVGFESNWEGCYKANLHLRTATRILKPILDFPAYQYEELYDNVLKHDFTKYIDPNGTIAVDAVVRESKLSDQRMIALKVKDAIVDQFRDKFGVRPNVDTKNPWLKIVVRVVKNQVSMAIDTSGTSLSLRGYRSEAGDAPLREHLAAAIVQMTGWDKESVIYDPMCGSGTLLIEAALMARKIAPGTLSKGFCFQKFNGFQEDVWSRLV
jgi:putative N6-adenine-specific DNA methylase